MREAKTIDAGNGQVKLWPDGIRFESAVLVKSVEYGHYQLEVWRCTLPDFENNTITYLCGLVWPKVWHKPTPAYGEMHLQSHVKTPATPEGVVTGVMAAIEKLENGDLDAVVADVDAVIDAREPDAFDREN